MHIFMDWFNNIWSEKIARLTAQARKNMKSPHQNWQFSRLHPTCEARPLLILPENATHTSFLQQCFISPNGFLFILSVHIQLSLSASVRAASHTWTAMPMTSAPSLHERFHARSSLSAQLPPLLPAAARHGVWLLQLLHASRESHSDLGNTHITMYTRFVSCSNTWGFKCIVSHLCQNCAKRYRVWYYVIVGFFFCH